MRDSLNILIYGTTTTNDRIGYTEKTLTRLGYSTYRLGEDPIRNIVEFFKADVVYISPFYHSHRKFLVLCMLFRKRIITDFYVSFYDMVVNDKKIMNSNSKKAKVLMKLDQFAVDASNYVIFLNEGERQLYLKTINRENSLRKSICIPLVISKRKPARLPWWHENGKIFKIVFCGNYIPLHGIEKIIQAIQLLSAVRQDFHLIMWSNKDTIKEAERYQHLAHMLDIDKFITFRNDWEKEEYESYCINYCDCMLGVFGDSDKAHTVIPNKVVDALSFSIPCITGHSSGGSLFFQQGSVYMIEHDAKVLADSISALMDRKLLDIEEDIRIGNKIYTENFSEESFCNNWHALLQRLFSLD